MEGLFKVFENNLYNWIVLSAGLAFLWFKFMPGIFSDRERRINEALNRAAIAREEGRKLLEEQRIRINNAEREADQILVDAKRVAEDMRMQIGEQAKKEAADLQKKVEQQITTHRQMVITELRAQAATVAVRLAEASLPGAITPNVKKGLQERFVTQLESLGSSK